MTLKLAPLAVAGSSAQDGGTPADLAHLAAYGFIGAALLSVLARRLRIAGPDTVVDVLTLVVASFLLVWSLSLEEPAARRAAGRTGDAPGPARRLPAPRHRAARARAAGCSSTGGPGPGRPPG